MKRLICLLLALGLLLGIVPSSSAQETKGTEIPDVTQYSYTITPILSPFTYLIYVETDNPDPTSFRFVDKTSKYYTKDSYGLIVDQTSNTNMSIAEADPGTYYISQALYPDVVFEDESTYRVSGGYIFRANGAYSDGGEFVLLQKKTDRDSIAYDQFAETNMVVTDRKGVTHTQDVCYCYNSIQDFWTAQFFYYGAFASSNTPMPEELILTHEEVAALDLDYNTNTWPTEGLVYDGTEYPGTPFAHQSVEQLIVPDTMTIRVGEKVRIN